MRVRAAAGFGLVLLLAATAVAAPAKGPAKGSAKKSAPGGGFPPESLGAQGFLEDLLARRYAQDLATLVERSEFTVGAQLELTELAPPKPKPPAEPAAANETPPDLLLGTLDPEALLAKYAGPEAVVWATTFLQHYRIRTVTLSVGLRETLPPEVKGQVEKWLRDRLAAEFGAAGKGGVALIRASAVPEKKIPVPAPPQNIWDWLNQYQALTGQLALAASILLGAILATLLWKLLSSRSQVKNLGDPLAEPVAAALSAPAPALEKPKEPDPELERREREQRQAEEQTLAAKEARGLAKRIQELIPGVPPADLEPMLRNWSGGGDDGRLRLACFVEAAGKSLGRLPVPADAIEDLTAIFSRMPELGIIAKRDALRKAYWDLLMSVNLGPAALEQPFTYLTGVAPHLVGEALLQQSSRARALVALYMPPALREKYLASLDPEGKRSLLETAAKLDEVARKDVQSFDQFLKTKLRPGAGKQGMVSTRTLLDKLLEPLTPLDEVTLLAGMSGARFDEVKRTRPSLAFVGYWPDDKLAILLSRAMPDEVVAFLRARPELEQRVIALSPPITAEVAADELARDDTRPAKESNRLLANLGARLKAMVSDQEVNLEAIFAVSPDALPEDSVPEDSDDERAA